MPSWMRRRLTYANVIATLALFLALNVGAYAAIKIPPNSIGSAQLKNKAVTPKKVSPAAIKLFKGAEGTPGSERAAGRRRRAGDGSRVRRSDAPRARPSRRRPRTSQTRISSIPRQACTASSFRSRRRTRSSTGRTSGGRTTRSPTVYVRRPGDPPPDDCTGNDNVRVQDARPGREPQHRVGDVFAGAAGPRFLHLVRIGHRWRPSALALALGAATLHAVWNLLLRRSTRHRGGDRGVRDRVRARPRAVRGGELGRRRRRLAVRPAVGRCSSSCTSRCSRLRTGASSCSLVYPVARGLAPVAALLYAVGSSGSDPSAGEIAGVAVVAAGVLLVRGARGSRGAALGLVIAAVIGGYTVIDRYGIQHANAFSYAFLILLPAALIYPPFVGLRRVRSSFVPVNVLVGVLSAAAYLLVLLALRRASAPAVAAVRETGVVIAAVLGAVFLHERVGAARYAGALLVVAGIALLALA